VSAGGAGVGIVLALSAAIGSSTAGQQSVLPTSPSTTHQAILKRYCISCHTQGQKARGSVPIALDTLDLSKVEANAEAWEKVVRKLRAGVMPPAGAPRPDQAAHDALLSWIETELDRSARVRPNPGRTEPFHRLNRAEYRNAIRDLLDVDVDVAALLPPDDASYGFDNIAGVLKVSPTLMERYLSAAQKVSRLAVGTSPLVPNIDYFRVSDDLGQNTQLPGLPFGTRGGMVIDYTFPMDAEYVISVRLFRDLNESVPLYLEAQQLEVSLDGERVGLFTLPGVRNQASSAANLRRAPAEAPPNELEDPQEPQGDPPPQEPQQPTQRLPQNAQPTQQAQRPAISQIQQTVRISAREREVRNREDENWNLRVPVRAGRREVAVTFINRTAALDETVRLPFLRPYPAGVNIPETRPGAYLRTVEISGPFLASGPGESPSRSRIFVCHPAASEGTKSRRSSQEIAASEGGCARTILLKLARRAYRRPVTEKDIQPLLSFFEEGRAQGGFEAGIERALRRLLVGPEFLFRIERDPLETAPSAPYRISDLELASRLSFFLWSSIPDDELLDVASKRQLRDPAMLARQVRRMIADRRAEAFVKNFAGQWLFLRNLPATGPVQSIFPDFDEGLRQAFQRETELFFDSIVREDRSALDLLDADYTFLNERLARHYDIPNVKGSHFRRVALPKDSVRRGLVGHGSILTVTSYPDRTSPVVRGKWILENLLGTPPPPPLPNVPALKPTNEAGAVLSMRERMAQHRANPVCASCHAMMDPLGLSLENFDGVGKWRTLGESGTPVDASGVFPDGTKFNGPAGLRQALVQSDRFVTTLTEKLLTYALGRGLEYYDGPAVRAIVRGAAAKDYQFSSFILGVVQSTPFRMRMAHE
jgi:mono/diheme cytochrome c family protein